MKNYKYLIPLVVIIVILLIAIGIKYKAKKDAEVKKPTDTPIEEVEETPNEEVVEEDKAEQILAEIRAIEEESEVELPTKASITDQTINFDSSFPNDIKGDIDSTLRYFFERYYRILSNLEYEDVSDMFSNKEYAYIYKTALEVLIENRKMNSLDLSLSDVKYELTVKNYSKSGEKISFKVLENCSYHFAIAKEYPTAVYNIENNFTLVKVDGEYKISYYKKVQDFYVMITDVYSSTSNYEAALNKIKSNYLAKFESQNKTIATMKTNYLSGNIETKTCNHEYNRENAYKYAVTWVGRRNTAKWHTYSANCVNFVSQVMYAGGIPMDHTGSYQWKWYSTTKNTANTASGFVYSWTYVPSIVSYFKYNTGYGLCGKYNENLYLGDVGDVIVVGTTGPTRHVITVIGQIKDEDGNVIDLLVNSNTVDLEFFPLSAYAYPYKILMKVYGWND